jgi:hypothetical protein
MATLYEVVDNAFNQENYPDLIGKRMFSPPSYAQVKRIESADLIGLSLSACVKSIVDNSELSIDDVRYIITGTKAQTESDWEEIFNRYIESCWNKYEPSIYKSIFDQLRNKHMIIQPRNYSDYRLVNPTAESATYGIWIESKKLFERHFYRIKKALDDIKDYGPSDDILNQIDASSQWLRMMNHYKIYWYLG